MENNRIPKQLLFGELSKTTALRSDGEISSSGYKDTRDWRRLVYYLHKIDSSGQQFNNNNNTLQIKSEGLPTLIA